MKFEIGNTKPESFIETWPGQYDFFSHFEFVGSVPHALFMITTLKENGQPNACFHSWSAFSGDGGGFHAVMTGLGQHTHTYKNILREKEFCINFLNPSYYDACIATINENSDDTDEFAVAGFTMEQAKCINAPRIAEAFLSLECTLKSSMDLSGKGIIATVIGEVLHVAVDENHNDIDSFCGEDAFMYNIHCPKDPITGSGQGSALAKLTVIKRTD